MSRTFNEAKQRELFRRTVKTCMARKGIDTFSELAPMLGMDKACVSQRMCWRSAWKLGELWRLFRLLEPDDDEIKVLMGVSSK